MNSPLLLVYLEMQKGADAITALDRAAARYPDAFPQQTVAQAKMLLGRGDRGQLVQLAQNMAKERGTTLEDVAQSVARQLGITK